MALDSAAGSGMGSILTRQKAANLRDGIPSAARRIEWIDKAIDLLITHGDAFNEAMCDDFGHRSKDQSGFTDIVSSIAALKFAKKHLHKWMQPEKRKVEFPLGLLGSKAQLQFQPKGVIGVISPWNFPVNLTFTPLAGVFAAGNRCMIKPSEFTEATSELMKSVIAQYYDADEVAVITGGPEVGAEFTKLPFDHILFTGATSIAHHVMRAAADNLVPLTLELGGKSPNIIFDDASIDQAVEGIVSGIYFNQGHVCCAGSRLFVQEGVADEVIAKLKIRLESLRVGDPLDKNTDVGAINSKPQLETIERYFGIARDEGLGVYESPCELPSSGYWCKPAFFTGVQASHTVAREEIFGPVLAVQTFRTPEEAITRANNSPYGLAAGVWTDKGSKIFEIAGQLKAGIVWLNCYNRFDPASPFGGYKESGFGREGGMQGLRGYVRL